MKVQRAYIKANIVDSVMSFVRHINFRFENIENLSLFADKTEFFHRAELVSNPKGIWSLELSIHCALSGSVIRKFVVR